MGTAEYCDLGKGMRLLCAAQALCLQHVHAAGQTPDLFGHKYRLGKRVVCAHQTDRAGCRLVGVQLPHAAGIFLYHSTGRPQDLRCRTVIFNQADSLHRGELLL